MVSLVFRRGRRCFVNAFVVSNRKFRNCIGMLLLCIAAAACTPEDGYRQYSGALRPELSSAQTGRNTALLARYASDICRQADLPVDGFNRCLIKSTSDWKRFVDMGLYDIDQRCDTFLDALYYKEKTSDAVLAQVSATRSVSRAVLEASSVSMMALRIVAAAFDFSESTFRNANTTLLEALDPTTVKSIVLRRQQEVKQQIYDATITSKPQALHALRTYLRVCLPFAIEMEANAVLTTAQRTGSNGFSPIIFEGPKTADDLPSRGVVAERTGIAADPAEVVALFGPGSGRTRDSVRRVQERLCATPDGNVGAGTRTAVTIYRITVGANRDWRPLSADEAKTILGFPVCGKQFLNYYESVTLASPVQVGIIVNAFNKKASGDEILTAADTISSDSNSSFRIKIAALKTRLPELATDTFETGTATQLTPAFVENLEK
jgi:hypothetical protein